MRYFVTRYFFIILIACFGLLSCGTLNFESAPEVTYATQSDDFSGVEFKQIALPRDNNRRNYLGFRRFPNDETVVVAVNYRSSDWRFIDALYFLVDGESQLLVEGQYDRNVNSGSVSEWVTWISNLNELAFFTSNTSTVRYSARGSGGRVDYELSREQIDALIDFLNSPYEEIPTTPTLF
jgi:hypothetical protein